MEEMVSKYTITINGKAFSVEVGSVLAPPVEVVVNGERKVVEFTEATAAPSVPAAAVATPAPAPSPAPAAPSPVPAAPAAATPVVAPAGAVEGQSINAPMPGKILTLLVQVGGAVSEGDTVCTLEAMKMEMPISATASGSVKAIHVQVGANVSYDDPLVTIG